MATDSYGNYSSARGKKASSKFTRLNAFFKRREAEKRQFMLEERLDGLYVRPIPRFK
jgi:hypothetical protein